MSGAARALVLDFGGVIARTMFETHRATEKALGLVPNSLTWRGPFEPGTDTLWQSLQRDEISEREYWSVRTREVAKLAGADWQEMSQFVRGARAADPQVAIRPEALEAIELACSASVRLGILSNELDLFYGEQFRQRLPWLDTFDSIVDATYTGILKPDRRAYEASAAQLGVAAADCVFVDDQARNIRGAHAFGMRTVHFDVTQPRRSYNDALALLGLAMPEKANA